MRRAHAALGGAALALFSIAIVAIGCNNQTGGTPARDQPHGAALPVGNPHPGICPVTGETVDVAKANADPKLHSDYQGKRYLFCCADCKPDFEKDPAKFITNLVHPKGEEGKATPTHEGHDHDDHGH
jgi:YHS domain-containing protein